MAKKQKDRAELAKAIAAAWQRSRDAIFETGRLLVAAKQKLQHGEWLKMVKHDLPFTERTAERLMAIASDRRLSYSTRASDLPPSWTALYAISRLTDEDFAAAIEQGVITPDMTRDDLAEWRKERHAMTLPWRSTPPPSKSDEAPASDAPAVETFLPDCPSPSSADPDEPEPDEPEDHDDDDDGRSQARNVIRSLVSLARAARRGLRPDVIRNILLDPAEAGADLWHVRRAIEAVIAVRDALDGGPPRPTLRVIEKSELH